MSFPRIIHQTWKTSDLPDFPARCVSTMKAMHPGWEHRFYEDADMEAVIADCDMISVEDFRKIPTGIEKADVFRCAVLFRDGGVYCDVDMEAVRPMEEMFELAVWDGFVNGGEEMLMTTDHPIHCERLYGHDVVMNNFMVAMPEASFLGEFLHEVGLAAREERLGGDPVHSTGPARITRMIHETGGLSKCGMSLLPASWVNPLPDMALNFPEVREYEEMIVTGSWRKKMELFLVHHWWHSYCGNRGNAGRYGEEMWKGG